MLNVLIKNAQVYYENTLQKADMLVENGTVVSVGNGIAVSSDIPVVDAEEAFRSGETEDGVHYTYLPCKSGKLINRLTTMWNAFCTIIKWHREHPKGIVICDIILGELSLALWAASLICRVKTVAIVTDVPSIRAGETRTGIKAIPFRIKKPMF